MNMDFKRKLAIPMEVKEMYPLTGTMSAIKEEKDAEIRKIFSGNVGALGKFGGFADTAADDFLVDLFKQGYDFRVGHG